MATLFRSGPTSGKAVKVISGFRSTGYNPTPIETTTSKVAVPADHCTDPLTTNTLQERVNFKYGPFSSGMRALKGVNVTSRPGQQPVRWAHTDVVFPDYTDYRRDSTKDPTQPARVSEDARRAFSNAVIYGAGGLLFAAIGKEAVVKIVEYKAMAADQLALAAVEINISEIPEGKCQTFEWRGKPVFVRHRTAEEIEKERAVNVTELRDPQHDDERVQNPDWSVLIGVCTHLGCVPIAGAGDFGGYYCPCHGSHYDASGRIRKGPAPLNLEVPVYSFKDESTLVVGSDD